MLVVLSYTSSEKATTLLAHWEMMLGIRGLMVAAAVYV